MVPGEDENKDSRCHSRLLH